MDSRDDVIFEYSLYANQHDEEPVPEREGEVIMIKAVFEGPNAHKQFQLEVTRLYGPAGMKVKAVGDYPPHQISESLVSYLVKRADECGETMLNAMGEVMFACCLDLANRYYIKTPYIPDSSEPTRFFAQPCGRGYKKHWHLIPLDPITKKPVDLVEIMNDHTLPTLGAALEKAGGHIFKGFEDETSPRSRLEDITKRMIAEATGKSEDDVEVINLQGKDLTISDIENLLKKKMGKKKEVEPEIDTSGEDILSKLWNAPTVEKRNTEIIEEPSEGLDFFGDGQKYTIDLAALLKPKDDEEKDAE